MGKRPQPAGLDRLAVLTIDEAADLLRCSRGHVYNLIRDEGLPVTRLGGRTVIRAVELDAWLSANTERAS